MARVTPARAPTLSQRALAHGLRARPHLVQAPVSPHVLAAEPLLTRLQGRFDTWQGVTGQRAAYGTGRCQNAQRARLYLATHKALVCVEEVELMKLLCKLNWSSETHHVWEIVDLESLGDCAR